VRSPQESNPDPSGELRDVRMGPGGWLVTMALALLFTVIGVYWTRESGGLLTATPPIPALATLVVLIALARGLGALSGPLRLSRQQIIVIYAFVSVSVVMGFGGFYNNMLIWLTAPTYGLEPNLERIKPFVPGWLVPTDEVVVKQFWEGSPTKAVPWGEWLVPLLSMGGMTLLFYVVAVCLLRLLHKRWSREERLTYPIAQLALSMVEQEGRGRGGAMWGNRIFWVGAASALAFNLIYIIPSLHPTWPIPPVQISMGQYLPDPPWNAAGKWDIRLNPLVFGLGFLVSMDVLLTIWLGFLFQKFLAIFLASWGVPRWSLFLIGEQHGIGSYTAMALLMLWSARHYIARAVRRLLPRAGHDAPEEAGRWTIVFLVGSIAGLFYIFLRVGMAPWLAGVFMGLLLVRILAVARIRAQAGVPQMYLHAAEVRNLAWVLSGAWLAMSGARSYCALALLYFLPSAAYMVPHHADAFKLAERSGISTRTWSVLAVVAVVLGFGLATLTRLPAYYEEGAVNIQGWTPQTVDYYSGYIITAAVRSEPHDNTRVAMISTGFITTCVLMYMKRFYWFPFHPAGYLVACAVGFRIWAPIFAIWAIKWTILRYFGGEVHRKAKNYFLGLVMGHFFIATVWSFLALAEWPPTERFGIGFW